MPTYSPRTLSACSGAAPVRPAGAVREHCKQSTQVRSGGGPAARATGRARQSSVRARAGDLGLNTTRGWPPSPGPSGRAADRSRRSPPGKCTLPAGAPRRERCQASARAEPPDRRVESPGRLSRSHPFASKRFHVLLNSLFKVLFNFPSRYLSAIGLVSVFSLRWSLPPTLGCIPKQPDSWDAQSGRRPAPVRA